MHRWSFFLCARQAQPGATLRADLLPPAGEQPPLLLQLLTQLQQAVSQRGRQALTNTGQPVELQLGKSQGSRPKRLLRAAAVSSAPQPRFMALAPVQGQSAMILRKHIVQLQPAAGLTARQQFPASTGKGMPIFDHLQQL